MKIKCIRTFFEYPKSYRVINNDIKTIKKEQEFIVFGLTYSYSILYFYIFNNNHLIEVPQELFTIIDPKVSKYWEIKNDCGDITLWPALFYEKDFLENMSEYEEEERGRFKELKVKMENEFE
jgi:hypothetical protein